MKLIEVLNKRFGHETFRGFQREVIESLIAGHDVLTVMPTGAGKSICFQIPALMRDGVGIVFSPLISLMRDQVESLNAKGIAAAYLNSGQTYEERAEVFRRLKSGRIKLLYLAPEALASVGTANFLFSLKIALIAIDEAHCISTWGHDFRPDYELLSQFKTRLPEVPIAAVTATADLETRAEICEKLLRNPKIFLGSTDRSNLTYGAASKVCRPELLLEFIQKRHPGESGIVFTGSREKSHKFAEFLRRAGVNALVYHAGLTAEERAESQNRFLLESDAVMVATVAFGMGIDKPDVRFVVHSYLPKSLESYVQEAGRAGRDGKAAEVWMCCTRSEAYIQAQRIENQDSAPWFKSLSMMKLEAVQAYLEAAECRRSLILRYFGEEPEQDCRTCDNCRQPPRSWDATEAAKKFLSAVWRVRNKTGRGVDAAQIISILLGIPTPENLNNEFEKLSTWGIGRDLDEKAWRQLYRYLCLTRLLDAEHGDDGVLTLNFNSADFLKGSDRKILLRRK